MEGSKEAVLKFHHKRLSDEEVLKKLVHIFDGVPLEPTRASVRIGYFLDDYFIKNSVQHFFQDLREQLEIPPEGLPLTIELAIELLTDPLYVYDGVSKKTFSTIIKKRNQFLRSELPFQTSIRFYGLANLFLISNAYSPALASRVLREENTLRIIDAREWWAECEPVDDVTTETFLGKIETLKNQCPIQIGLSSGTGLGEIKDYLDKNWKHIEGLLDFYKDPEDAEIKAYRTRDSSIRERNRFIYENRHLPQGDILILLKDEGFKARPTLGEIGKIISLEVGIRN
jgi:hypothetical protein